MLPSATVEEPPPADDTDGQIDMDVVVAKVLALIIITILTVLSGLLPCRLLQHFGRTMLRRSRNFDHAVSGAKCFAGGVFLGTCFLHLIPETRSKVDIILENLGSRSKYPVAELLTIAGFFGVIFGEHVIRFIYYKIEEDNCCPNFESDSYSFDKDYIRSIHDAETEGCDLIECNSLHSISQKSLTNSQEDFNIQSLNTRQDSTNVPTININGKVPGNTNVTQNCQVSNSNSPNHNSCSSVHNEPTAQLCNSIKGVERFDMEIIPAPLQDLEVKTVVTEISKGEESTKSHFRSVLLLAALSFHGVFEGMALGLQSKESDVWIMCIAIVVHRGILSFGMSLQYARNNDRPSTIIFSISTFAIICVVGIVIGIAISTGAQLYDDVDVPNALLQSLATGTIFYIIFLNILFKELDGNKDVKKISCTFVGFASMAILLAVVKT